MTIEGIPDGWELIGIRYACENEYFINNQGQIEKWTLSRESGVVLPIIRKIEKPKRYRAFENAAEFEPHRDRWIEYTSPNHGDCSFYRVTSFHNERVWLGPDNSGKTYREAFHCLKFDDGTPFGIEVTE